MAEAEHSLFSASGADGWSICHGKPAMEEGRKTSSEYADEGTAAHTLASWVLEARLGASGAVGLKATAENYLGHKIVVRRWDAQAKRHSVRTFTVDSDMAEHVDTYVDRFFLYANARKAERFCEQRVNYSAYLDVPKALAWGTSDGVAILFDQPELEWEDAEGVTHYFPPGDELQVHDLKYGAGVQVFADTLQLKLYGAGTFYEWEHVANFTRVRLVIHQPRKDHVDELVITPAELIKAVRELRPAVPRVMEAMELANAYREENPADSMGPGEALHRRGFLVPTEKGCRFCDAKAVCPALIESVGEALTGRPCSPDDFEDLTVDGRAEVREYGGNYLAAAFALLPLVEDWSKAVRAEIDHRVLNKGEKFDGLKVVAGKRGARQWKDKGKAEALAMTLPAPIQALIYKRELKSPAQLMDKALKTSPMTAARFAALIEQAEGKKAVVPTRDTRPAISHKSVADQFEDLTLEDEAEETPTRVGARVGRDPHPFR